MLRFIYFTSVVIWGYLIMKDNEYFPVLLGGSGDFPIGLTPKYFPYAPRKLNCGLKNYILVTSGFHLYNFMKHVLDSKKNDFIEMGLHHVVALYLFGGLYFLNFWENGAAFAFLHDIADIFIMAARTFGETNHSNFAGGIFACAMIVWFYTRIIVLPYLIYLVIISDVKVGYCSKEIFVYLLSCMFVLHCYWFFLFFKIIKKFIVTGVAEDTVNKVESNKQK